VPIQCLHTKGFCCQYQNYQRKLQENTFKIAEIVPWAVVTVNDLNTSEAYWQLIHCVTNI